MKRNRPPSRKRISTDATELGRLATCLSEAGGKLEDAFWEKQLSELVDKLLHDGAEDDLNASLDRLFDSHVEAHDCLADIIESRAESCVMSNQGSDYDILLFNVPLLAWSRFSIPAGTIPKSTLQTLKVQLGAHVFAAGAQLAVADYLYSPDQLPRSFVETWQPVPKDQFMGAFIWEWCPLGHVTDHGTYSLQDTPALNNVVLKWFAAP